MLAKPEFNLPISEETKLTGWVQKKEKKKEKKPRALLAALRGPHSCCLSLKAILGLHLLKRLLCQVVALYP